MFVVWNTFFISSSKQSYTRPSRLHNILSYNNDRNHHTNSRSQQISGLNPHKTHITTCSIQCTACISYELIFLSCHHQRINHNVIGRVFQRHLDKSYTPCHGSFRTRRMCLWLVSGFWCSVYSFKSHILILHWRQKWHVVYLLTSVTLRTNEFICESKTH